MQYRRLYIKGGTYFFTLVTYNRKPIFSSVAAVQLLSTALTYTASRMPFETVAYVILPDHLHYIFTLPIESSDFSTRWRLIKSHFTRQWCKEGSISNHPSRIKKGELDVWQRRFWEHLIRDETDLARHIEYIHYNPVKHGFVNAAMEWKYSSFMDFVRDGMYPSNWGENGKVWAGLGSME